MRQAVVVMLLALFLAGCSSKPVTPVPKPDPVAPGPQNGPAGETGGPVTQPTSPRYVYRPFPGVANRFFPTHELRVEWLRLTPGAEPQTVQESWVYQMNGLLTAVRDHRPVWNWLVSDEEVWAPDPHNPSVLLRFLPPNPHSGMAWRHEFGGESVWFRLLQGASDNPDEWQLTVLNRGQRTEYTFGPLLTKIVEPGATWQLVAMNGLSILEREQSLKAIAPYGVIATKAAITETDLASFEAVLERME